MEESVASAILENDSIEVLVIYTLPVTVNKIGMSLNCFTCYRIQKLTVNVHLNLMHACGLILQTLLTRAAVVSGGQDFDCRIHPLTRAS